MGHYGLVRRDGLASPSHPLLDSSCRNAFGFAATGGCSGYHHAGQLPLDLWAIGRDMRSSLSQVLTRYFGDDEAIKFALAANLPFYSDDPDDFWWLGYAIAQGGYMRGGGYYIKGGSQTLSDRLAAIIREEGGERL